MSKRVKNTTVPKLPDYYKGKSPKLSKNAKRNKQLNHGMTAATGFYIRVAP